RHIQHRGGDIVAGNEIEQAIPIFAERAERQVVIETEGKKRGNGEGNQSKRQQPRHGQAGPRCPPGAWRARLLRLAALFRDPLFAVGTCHMDRANLSWSRRTDTPFPVAMAVSLCYCTSG